MTLNLEKCKFARSSITFVGHIIGSGQHGPACVENMQPFKTKKSKADPSLAYFPIFVHILTILQKWPYHLLICI